MRLQEKHKKHISKLYWVEGLPFTEVRKFKKYITLTESQFRTIVRNLCPYDFKKKPAIFGEFIYKEDRTSFFMSLTEDEQLDFRKRVPIPKETNKLFETGRLVAYYNNPIKWT